MGRNIEPIVRMIKPQEMSSFTRQMITENARFINSMSFGYNRPIVFAEKGDLILMNSGVKTGTLSIKDIKKPTDFMDFVHRTVRINDKIAQKGMNFYC